jgi:hypothetical protein
LVEIGVPVECESTRRGRRAETRSRIFVALARWACAPEQAWYIGDMPGIDVVGAPARTSTARDRPLWVPRGYGYDTITSLRDLAKRVEEARA